MKMTTMGIAIAKEVFQLHGVESQGKILIRKQIRRNEMLKFFANIQPCLIGMEACGGAHYGAREISKFGHTVKWMSPQFVKPYVKSNRNDRAAAETICEAVARPASYALYECKDGGSTSDIYQCIEQDKVL